MAQANLVRIGQPFFLYHGLIVPPNFPYFCILLQGRPRHDRDTFSALHPQMEREKRAKLFAPFDALDGYGDSIQRKNTIYCDKVELDESEKSELDRRLTILHELTCNSRKARQNQVCVEVTYYVPCTDHHSFSYGKRGQYVTMSGIVRSVDVDTTKTIVVQDVTIHFDDILSIRAKREGLFAQPWDE